MKKILGIALTLIFLTFGISVAQHGIGGGPIGGGGGGGGVTIDDTKGNGDTTYAWSADKIYDELALKQAAGTYCSPTEIVAATATSPSAAQLAACNATSIHNYGQAAADINVTLPATAANLGFMANVSTAQAANYWRFTAASAGTIYLNGSATGKDYVQYTVPVVGYYFACFTVNIGNAYKWYCSDGVGSLSTN